MDEDRHWVPAKGFGCEWHQFVSQRTPTDEWKQTLVLEYTEDHRNIKSTYYTRMWRLLTAILWLFTAGVPMVPMVLATNPMCVCLKGYAFLWLLGTLSLCKHTTHHIPTDNKTYFWFGSDGNQSQCHTMFMAIRTHIQYIKPFRLRFHLFWRSIQSYLFVYISLQMAFPSIATALAQTSWVSLAFSSSSLCFAESHAFCLHSYLIMQFSKCKGTGICLIAHICI